MRNQSESPWDFNTGTNFAVGNVQLSVVKLQFPALPTPFLNQEAAASNNDRVIVSVVAYTYPTVSC